MFYLLGPELFMKIVLSQFYGEEYESITSAWFKNQKESWQKATKEILGE